MYVCVVAKRHVVERFELTAVEFTDDQRDLLLAGLFELRITHAEDQDKGAQVEALVVLLGGDPYAVFFGAYGDSHGAAPVPDYPADETDEG